jgi:hypothetical protein
MPREETVSPTPLWRKLGLHEHDVVTLVAAPDAFAIADLPHGAVVAREPRSTRRRSPTDVAIAFLSEAAELRPTMTRLAPRIFPDGGLWLAWPRRAGGHESDLGDVVVRDTALEFGLVDVKVAAISADWSGLRFVWRKELRRDAGANDATVDRGGRR